MNRAKIIDGQAIAKKIIESLEPRLAAFKKTKGRAPFLAIIAQEQQASQAYLHSKLKACRELGIETAVHCLPRNIRLKEITGMLEMLGRDSFTEGVSLDLPLPPGLDTAAVLCALPSAKDVDGLAPINYGKLFMAKTHEDIRRLLIPCTARAIVEILKSAHSAPEGKRAVVIGRSAIVGRPTAHLLSVLNATVTLCHSRTLDLAGEVARADIVVACLGRPQRIKGEWIKKQAVIIDAGINFSNGKICGDVDFAQASRTASAITPVPGGVGPVTAAILLANTVLAAERSLTL